jgi:hypothetical protein
MNTKNTSPRNLNENPESSTFFHKFERGITKKRTTRGSCVHPSPKPQRGGDKFIKRKSPKKALKITNNGKRERHHAKPSIHAMKDSYKV